MSLSPHSAFLSSLHSQTEEQALSQLLAHLPLLNPGSNEARGEYMKLLPKVMLGSSEELTYLDECRQLLSLALVHPAFPLEDREALTFWLSQLDRKQKNIVDRKAPSPQRPPPIPPRIYQIKSTPEETSWNSTGGTVIGSTGGSGRINISGELSLVGEIDGFSETNNHTHIDEELGSKSNSLPTGHSLLVSTPSTCESIFTDHHPTGAPSYDEFAAHVAKSNSIPASGSLTLGSYPPASPVASTSIEEAFNVCAPGQQQQQFDWKDGMKGKHGNTHLP